MASNLGDNLVDDLLPTIDDLRGDLLPAFGTRQYEVKLVTRTWTGTERGDGESSDSEVLISPPPRVETDAPPSGLHYELRPQGRIEEGTVKLTEISLAGYQEDDLTGGTLDSNVEFFWALEDAQGQGIRKRYYVLAAPPFADREKTLGWVVYLRRALGGDCGLDG